MEASVVLTAILHFLVASLRLSGQGCRELAQISVSVGPLPRQWAAAPAGQT